MSSQRAQEIEIFSLFMKSTSTFLKSFMKMICLIEIIASTQPNLEYLLIFH